MSTRIRGLLLVAYAETPESIRALAKATRHIRVPLADTWRSSDTDYHQYADLDGGFDAWAARVTQRHDVFLVTSRYIGPRISQVVRHALTARKACWLAYASNLEEPGEYDVRPITSVKTIPGQRVCRVCTGR